MIFKKFKQDDDGHWYLISIDHESDFDKLLYETDDDSREFNNRFARFRCEHPSNYIVSADYDG